MTSIFHIAAASDWDAALTRGNYTVSTLGRSLDDVGFIHCSQAHQVAGVAEMVYRDEHELVLLEIDPARLEVELRYERPSDRDEDFPHIYGPLNVDAVTAVTPFDPRSQA